MHDEYITLTEVAQSKCFEKPTKKLQLCLTTFKARNHHRRIQTKLNLPVSSKSLTLTEVGQSKCFEKPTNQFSPLLCQRPPHPEETLYIINIKTHNRIGALRIVGS